MEQKECNKEVSKSSSEDSESLENVPLAHRGTPISLKGNIIQDFVHAVVVKVEYKEVSYSGVLMEANNTWGPHNPSLPQKNKESNPSNELETKKNDDMKRTQRKQTFSPSKNTITCVDPSNIIKSKLRSERVTSCNPCSMSPILYTSGNSTFSSGGNDIDVVSTSDSDLIISSSKDEKCSDETFIAAPDSSTLPSKKTDGYHSLSQKTKNCESRKKFETKESGSTLTQTKSVKFTSICSNSLSLDNSGNSLFSSSGNDVNSVSVSDRDLKITSDEKCLDETDIFASDSSTLPSKKTDDCHSPSEKMKKFQSSENFETKVSGAKQTQKKYEPFNSKKYPQCFVHKCNTIVSRLRSDSIKLTSSSSTCPSSSRLDNSENIEFRSSDSNMNSATVSGRVETRNSTFLSSACDMNSVSETAAESPIPRLIIRIKFNNANREAHCNEVDSIETSDDLSNKFDNNLELGKDSMPRISRCDMEETDETIKENWNSVMSVESIENSDGMPNLQPIEPHLPRLKKVSSTFSDTSISTVEDSTEVFEEY